ncbi:MAG: diguanylate cyclase [Hespellia sp.]|nr:diguanylate cyclase [Hespellia sp.]
MNEQEKLLLFLEHILMECDGEQIDTSEYSEGYHELAQALNETSKYIFDAHAFALDIADGNLEGDAPPKENMLSGPFRALRSSLLHLTWQTQRVAAGDYRQHVDFLGDFAESFNRMISQLEFREHQLTEAADRESQRANELHNNNELLMSITELVDDWIIMIDQDSPTPSFLNNAARYGIKDYELTLSEVCTRLVENRRGPSDQKWDLILCNPKPGLEPLEFSVSMYPIHRSSCIATLYILRDTTQQRRKMREMEILIYCDPATRLYNRRYCLQLLDALLRKKERFSLCFIDLNNLKFINDHFGHESGDEYILLVADSIRQILRQDDVICRFGGDEMVSILRECTSLHALHRMEDVQRSIVALGKEKGWDTSISYGIVQIDGTELLTSHELIKRADKRMYEFKTDYKRNDE